MIISEEHLDYLDCLRESGVNKHNSKELYL